MRNMAKHGQRSMHGLERLTVPQLRAIAVPAMTERYLVFLCVDSATGVWPMLWVWAQSSVDVVVWLVNAIVPTG